jgi:hypothetical protein
MQGSALSKDEVHQVPAYLLAIHLAALFTRLQQRLEAKARRESARSRPKSKFY